MTDAEVNDSLASDARPRWWQSAARARCIRQCGAILNAGSEAANAVGASPSFNHAREPTRARVRRGASFVDNGCNRGSPRLHKVRAACRLAIAPPWMQLLSDN